MHPPPEEAKAFKLSQKAEPEALLAPTLFPSNQKPVLLWPVASDQVCVKRMTTALTKEWQLPDPRGVTRLGKALKVKFE
ncbi:hypothetical protein E5288_WYG015331 [Bos mutus]|uniref:Uncharacterized protein n=1 Tax=Bos mutus TaxID=72004 RepID=A0A6B0RIP1_9CETA|nr:hypothetical protein [Bos mutus]